MYEYTILTKIRSKTKIKILDTAERYCYFKTRLPISAAVITGFVVRNEQEIVIREIIRREV